MTQIYQHRLSFVLGLLLIAATCTSAARINEELLGVKISANKHPYKSPQGLFIQERASKELPGPGQHFSFGALVSWEEIHKVLDSDPSSKLLILIRHGEAYSNWLERYMGPDKWFSAETTCSYDDPKQNKTYGVFDAELTDLGVREAESLNSLLGNGGWYDKLTQNRTTRTIVSPLSRCLQTSIETFRDIPVPRFDVEESIRETLGEDTCDARRSASDPGPADEHGPCRYTQGLRSKFPTFDFPIVGNLDAEEEEDQKEVGATRKPKPAFGLLSDTDELWTTTREVQKHQMKRARAFLTKVFRSAEQQVIFVVTHSGTIRSLLLDVGREPYRPQNSELVPVIVQKRLA